MTALPPAPLPVLPTLVAENLGHAFGSRVLFRGVSFTLEPGQTLAVVGRNGAGKSTLATVLAGLRQPRKGRATLRLGDASAPPRSATLVAPYLGLYDALTPREHLAFLADARPDDRALRNRIAPVLDAVGLSTRTHDPVGTFSSGMRQRVRYACALLPAPPLLVLDEPTATLDADGAALVDAVRAWQQERGGLLVVATNDPAEALWGDLAVRIDGRD